MFNVECGVINRLLRCNPILFKQVSFMVFWSSPHHTPIKYRCPNKKYNRILWAYVIICLNSPSVVGQSTICGLVNPLVKIICIKPTNIVFPTKTMAMLGSSWSFGHYLAAQIDEEVLTWTLQMLQTDWARSQPAFQSGSWNLEDLCLDSWSHSWTRLISIG